MRLRLSDFANEELVQKEIGDQAQELVVSTEQLCQYLTAAETKVHQAGLLSKHSISSEVKKRRRSETPPEEITSGDEARYTKQKERAAKQIAEDDPDYEDRSSTNSLLD